MGQAMVKEKSKITHFQDHWSLLVLGPEKVIRSNRRLLTLKIARDY